MLENINLQDVLFIDIETVAQRKTMDELSENIQKYWEKKSKQFRKEEETASDIYDKAGIYAEFGKIICISVGVIDNDKFWVKSFFGHDEKQLLTEFAAMMKKPKNSNKYLCGHNIKEFDIPYIARRMLINNIELPVAFDLAGKKPWEVKHLDTFELWKFGDYKHFTSLALLAEILNIPTPKDDIDGSQVYEVYYVENNLERIATYCEKDVLCVANILLRFMRKNIISFEQIEKPTKIIG